tara:strand:+ start:1059 stop:2645 length:1587 start_codon:yes stop_codon:yes gene_type:complete
MTEVISRDIKLNLNDGTNLISRIWHPEEGGPWPAILMRQPYSREIASTITYLHPSCWARQGFLVVIQDVRGQGGSEGCFQGFAQESSDTTQTHRWVRSLPECNGMLGTYGFSYQGLTQLLAESGAEPPTCLAPAMTGLDEGSHWSCEGGAYWWHIGLAWGLQLAAQKAKREEDFNAWDEIRSSLENQTYLRNGESLLKKYDPEGMAMKWLNISNKKIQRWKKYIPLNEWIKRPMLLIGGWWDPHLIGILDIYQKSLLAGGNPEIYIGPATHLHWWEGAQDILLKFFKKHLHQKYQPDKNINRPIIWNLTEKEWFNSRTNLETYKWYLSGKGNACLDSKDGSLRTFSEKEENQIIVHDPWRPVPAIGGHLSPSPGEADRMQIDKRSDVALFTSMPFTSRTRIEGKPKLSIKVSSDQKGFDLCAAISKVDPLNSKAMQLSTGFMRIVGDNAKLLLKRELNFQPFFADFLEGEFLRLSISCSAWPAISINTGNPKISPGPPSAFCNVITLKLQLFKSKLEIYPLFPQEDFQ